MKKVHKDYQLGEKTIYMEREREEESGSEQELWLALVGILRRKQFFLLCRKIVAKVREILAPCKILESHLFCV